MQEIIGKITLDYTYYPGEDLYSDGIVEDQLLAIAMNHKEEELNRVIADEKSWPVMYHFSHIRQNILEWLPISKKDQVLEIGSGCGAITGALARKAGSVRCIELSKKRSYINAYRNQEFDNVRIDVGNFQDIEKNLTETFDYITLIGVFEYSEGYIGGKTPYVDMLKKISGHLKPGGKIVIAIENRLGLKYFAGCREDHVGECFEGLEGYHHTDGVRTFSKTELEKIIKDAGEFKTDFYYPYPDYKFPLIVYSDDRLPAVGELNNNINNFDRERLQLFNETNVYDTLLESELFPEFSNSFLVILTAPGEEQADEKLIYTKYSNERAGEFAIRTDMVKDSKGRPTVRKCAYHLSGNDHIHNILRFYEALTKQYEGTLIRMNHAKATDSGVEFEYLTGITLEESIDTLIANQQFEEAKDMLLQYLNTVKDAGKQQTFQMTESFCKVFGNPIFDKELKSLSVTDIDMVLGNVLLQDGWNLIDYEWTFDFPIPVSFVLFRIIHYYSETSDLRSCVKEWNLYEAMGIDSREVEQYLEMERHFQSYIQGVHVPIRDMYEDITPGVLNVYRMAEKEHKRVMDERLQVFYAGDEEFSEEHSVYYPMPQGKIAIRLEIPKNVRKLRIDPCSYAGLLHISNLIYLGGTCDQAYPEFVTNGFVMDQKRIAFGTSDPQILILQIPEGTEALMVEFEMEMASEQIGSFLQEMQQFPKQQEAEIARLKAELAQRERLITEMEHTKVWKAYKKVKSITGKGN